MTRFAAFAVFMYLAMTANPANACSIMPPSARALYPVADIVALARPLRVSQREVQREGEEVLQQTVVWRALMVWKGPFKHGDQFITRMYYGEAECTARFPVRQRTAQFFFGYGICEASSE